MTFEQWLTRLDLTQISLSALVVLGVGVFLWRKVWPWLVEVYWPGRVRHLEALAEARAAEERERTGVLMTMRDTLIELKVIAGQQLLLLQQHDTETRKATNALLEQQGVILERVRETDREASYARCD